MTAAPEPRSATLVDFLRDRIEEDESTALAAMADDYHVEGGLRWGEVGHETSPDLTIDPSRLLGDVAAKLSIVAEHEGAHDCVRYVHPDDNRDCRTLRHLAAVYADHEGYRDEWAV